jgi:hypothetical protein
VKTKKPNQVSENVCDKPEIRRPLALACWGACGSGLLSLRPGGDLSAPPPSDGLWNAGQVAAVAPLGAKDSFL